MNHALELAKSRPCSSNRSPFGPEQGGRSCRRRWPETVEDASPRLGPRLRSTAPAYRRGHRYCCSGCRCLERLRCEVRVFGRPEPLRRKRRPEPQSFQSREKASSAANYLSPLRAWQGAWRAPTAAAAATAAARWQQASGRGRGACQNATDRVRDADTIANVGRRGGAPTGPMAAAKAW